MISASNARPTTYLERLSARRRDHELAEQVVFGLTIGWLLVIAGGLHCLFGGKETESIWRAVCITGAVTLFTTVAAPFLLRWPQRLSKAFFGGIGSLLLKVLVTVVYIVAFWPVGIIMRWRAGGWPIVRWETHPTTERGGWEPIDTVVSGPRARRRSMLVEPFRVIGYFIKRRHFLALPSLILLIFLGMILFFVKSSALAPLIYTLF